MAYTKIHAIKATPAKAIEYICDKDKTEEQILISSFATSPETASYDFAATLSKTNLSDSNMAFHLIQSFAPGEVSYEEAHTIGKELAEKLLEGKYSYVLSTHVDHAHIHNHLIFCAANNIDYKKYYDTKANYYHIRELSDELCLSHELSVIIPGQTKGMSYKEWMSKKDGTSLKEALRYDIDSCIKQASDYNDFVTRMKADGYEMKGESFGEGSLKYISFRPIGMKNYIRGSIRSLGPNYTKEQIQNRIIEQTQKKQPMTIIPQSKASDALIDSEENVKYLIMDKFAHRKFRVAARPIRVTLIDINTAKLLSSPGLRTWAKKENLKAAAHAYAQVPDLAAYDKLIKKKKESIDSLKSQLASIEKKLLPASEIYHYAKVYHENLRYNKAMKASKDPDRYYREHADELHLFYSAEHALADRFKFDPASLDFKFVEAKYKKMLARKAFLSASIQDTSKELKDLENKLSTLKKYLDADEKNPESVADTQKLTTRSNKLHNEKNNHL